MKFLAFFSTLLIATTAWAQNPQTPASLPLPSPSTEQPGTVSASDFLSPSILSGPLHTVAASAYNDGFRNTYFVNTENSDLEITGTSNVVTQIRELYAIDALRKVSKTDEFGKAMERSAKQKIDGVVGIVSDPLGTVSRIPKGASRFFGRIGEGMKGGKSEGQDGALKSILGVSKAKMQLALKLGVSPYSTNQALQRALDDVAKPMALGGLLLNAATSFVGGPAGDILAGLGVNQQLQQTLVSSTPEDLRITNRKKLFALGIDRTLADEFLMNPWFSPWIATITTDALSQIGADPTTFLTQASKALTEDDAYYFQRLAQILAKYHADGAPIRSIRLTDGLITARDAKGALVVPVSLDYVTWNDRTARRTQDFAGIPQVDASVASVVFWTDGRISPRLAEELTVRRVAWRSGVLDVNPSGL